MTPTLESIWEGLKEQLLACCRLEFDRRGNVVDMTPREKQCDSHMLNDENKMLCWR